jgi:hypothetical protein
MTNIPYKQIALNHIIIYCFLIFIPDSNCQKYDFNWFVGYEYRPNEPNDTSESVNTITFNTVDGNPKIIYNYKSTLDFLYFGCNISSKNGEYLFSWDGKKIEDYQFKLTKRADEICPDYYCEALPQGSFILPNYLVSNTYHLLTTHVSVCGDSFVYFKVDQLNEAKLSNVNNEIRVEEPLLPVLQNVKMDYGKITACRHANGRDFWILAPSDSTNMFYTCLLNQDKISFKFVQSINNDKLLGLGYSCFSPNGEYYCLTSSIDHVDSMGGMLYFYHFNRQTGLLSEQEVHFTDRYPESYNYGVCFSPNSKFLYLCSAYVLYQYPIINGKLGERIEIARYDGFQSYVFNNFYTNTYFGQINHGPDGKLYICTTNYQKKHIHTIHKPNEKGIACDFRQHDMEFYSVMVNLPHFPHYRLGPIDGSICDTLGIDNVPWCHWRYNQDTAKPFRILFTDLSAYEVKKWRWDFGDGTQSDEINPIHDFSKKGSYKVCLIVSNEYGSDTLCRLLNLGVTSSEEINDASIKFYPNPVHDHLILDLERYIPMDGELEVFDLFGVRQCRQKLNQGQQEIQIGSLKEGIYLFIIKENGRIIYRQKILKVL